MKKKKPHHHHKDEEKLHHITAGAGAPTKCSSCGHSGHRGYICSADISDRDHPGLRCKCSA